MQNVTVFGGRLERLLRVNAKIAVENYKRYQAFHAEGTPELPALLAYTGIVFKRLNAKDFSKEEFEYAQEHLRLTSFCYGLLRPFGCHSFLSVGRRYSVAWTGQSDDVLLLQSRLTDVFIEDIKKAGGILCNLASDEMKSLLIGSGGKEVHVITPEFQVWKNGKLASIVIYIKNVPWWNDTVHSERIEIENPEDLKSFSWEGFEFNEQLSDETKICIYKRKNRMNRDDRNRKNA